MAKRGDSPLGTPCWVDLLTSDPERSQEFYGRLFGWTVEDPGADYGGYKNFQLKGEWVAGCMRNDGAAGDPRPVVGVPRGRRRRGDGGARRPTPAGR